MKWYDKVLYMPEVRMLHVAQFPQKTNVQHPRSIAHDCQLLLPNENGEVSKVTITQREIAQVRSYV